MLRARGASKVVVARLRLYRQGWANFGTRYARLSPGAETGPAHWSGSDVVGRKREENFIQPTQAQQRPSASSQLGRLTMRAFTCLKRQTACWTACSKEHHGQLHPWGETGQGLGVGPKGVGRRQADGAFLQPAGEPTPSPPSQTSQSSPGALGGYPAPRLAPDAATKYAAPMTSIAAKIKPRADEREAGRKRHRYSPNLRPRPGCKKKTLPRQG